MREYRGESSLEWEGRLGPDDPPRQPLTEDETYDKWLSQQPWEEELETESN